MKKIFIMLAVAILMAGCGNREQQLKERAAELCKYILDHELREESREFMTEVFYKVIDTMFNLMTVFEAMDHEWLYYFVTGNGGTIADFEVTGVEQQDNTHAVATISVRQKWEDGSFDPSSDIEEHRLYMEKVDGRWLISDFDEHKADCIRHIAINRWEQKLRAGITSFLIEEFGTKYDLCIPVLMIVAEEDCETEIAWVWGDFWVFNYKIAGDTLKTISGGNHPCRLQIGELSDSLYVMGYDPVEDGAGNDKSAREIFGKHYDVYQNMHSNEQVREAVRKEQLREYVKRNNLKVSCYHNSRAIKNQASSLSAPNGVK